MTRRRWIADEVSGSQAILTGRNAEHLSRVLRARVGQQFEIATTDGVRLGEIVARTDAHLASAASKLVERWRRIAHEASQQSRRDAAPEILDPEKLTNILAAARELRIVLSEAERDHSLLDEVKDAGECSLAIGPEGGWTNSELNQFQDAGWRSASLGPTILRAETAAIAALAIVRAAT